MAIIVTCAACRRKLRAPERMAGGKGICSLCGRPLDIPIGKASDNLEQALNDLGDAWALTSPIRKRPVWPWVVGAAGAGLLIIVVLVLVIVATSGGPASSFPASAASQPAAAPVRPKPVAETAPAPPNPIAHVPSAAPVSRTTLPVEPPSVVTPRPAEPSIAEAAPPALAGAPTTDEATSGSSVPPGPVQGAAAAQLSAIVNEWLLGLMSPDAAGAAAMRTGKAVEITRGSQRYLGVIYRPSIVLVIRGHVDVKELYVLTTNIWQLSRDLYLPPHTCIMVRNGTYELASQAALEAAASEAEAYVKKALAEIDAAVAQDDMERAKQVLAEAQARYPDSGALAKRAATFRIELNSVPIRIENSAMLPLSWRLSQRGAVLVAGAVRPGEITAIRVPRGIYFGEWSGPTANTGETVTLDRSQTWVFSLEGVPAGGGMTTELRWTRTTR